MDRRRSGTKTRPPTAEELQYWSQTLSSLTKIQQLQSATDFTKVNKWMATLPHQDPTAHHDSSQQDTLEALRNVKAKLTSGLAEIKTNADAEAKAVSDALESLSVLIALRRGQDGSSLPPDKRTKRIRNSSPASIPGSPRTAPHPQMGLQRSRGGDGSGSTYGSSVSGNAPSAGRSSQGPQSLRDAKAKREWLQSQLPLAPGRKVAFRQPPAKGSGRGGDAAAGDADGETWILAAVKRCLNLEKQKYEVQDDDTEDGVPEKRYPTTIANLLPLPDPDAPPNSPSHPNAYDEYPPGTSVLGLYPDTSCFYKAVVIAGPRDPPPAGTRSAGQAKSYRLKFEDDDDQIRAVHVQWVVEAPPENSATSG